MKIIIILFFLISLVMYSYVKGEPPLPKPSGPGPYPQLPIDGEVVYLLIAGVAYGVSKLKKS